MRISLSTIAAVFLVGLVGTVQAQTGAGTEDAPYVGPADKRTFAPGQGAQDPARSEVMEGRSADMHKCMATLIARREKADEAQVVCNKIISGIGE